jgi:hypothetical protein
MFRRTCRILLQGRKISCFPPAYTLVSCLAYSSTLKMKATCSSETSVDFQRITRRYIPDDRTIHYHRRENLKSYKNILVYIFYSLSLIHSQPYAIAFSWWLQISKLYGVFVVPYQWACFSHQYDMKIAPHWSANMHVWFASTDDDLSATARLLVENSRPTDN